MSPDSSIDSSINVLMVTKPLTPPWNDSSKNLAKDIAVHAENISFRVWTTPESSFAQPHIHSEPVYASSGTYAPGLGQNLQAFARLLRDDSDVNIYHFFFAPNYWTSNALKVLFRWKARKTVHTICSEPKTYQGLRKLIFSDRVIALSKHTERQLNQEGIPNVVCIPPGIDVEQVCRNSADGEYVRFRQNGGFHILFAGDYEFSGAHETVISSLPEVFKQVPEARFYFACRLKTQEARQKEREVRDKIRAMGFENKVSFFNEVDNMPGLIQAMDISIFPASSLYKKMDIPLVLLECLANKVPLVVSDLPQLSPLVEGGAVLEVQQKNPGLLIRAIVNLARDEGLRRNMAEMGFRLVNEEFNIKSVARKYESLYADLVRIPEKRKACCS